MLAGAHYVLGSVGFATGEFQAAREHLERAVELFDAGPSRSYSVLVAPVASGMLNSPWSKWSCRGVAVGDDR
jgi:hypothetical protein